MTQWEVGNVNTQVGHAHPQCHRAPDVEAADAGNAVAGTGIGKMPTKASQP